MTQEEATAKAEAFESQLKAAQEQVANAATKEELESAKEELTKTVSEKVSQLETKSENQDAVIKEQGEEITSLLRTKVVGSDETETIKTVLSKAIAEDESGFKDLRENQNGSFNTVAKVAGTMLTTTNTTGRVVRHERDNERTKPQRRSPFVLDYVNVSTTNAAVITYVEREAPDGNPGMTEEGAVKPLIDFDYVERTAIVRKMTARTKQSKEMMEDIDGFVSDTEDELIERLELLFDEQLLTGDGTGQNLRGVEADSTPFAAGALAASVDEANNHDVLRVAYLQVVLNNFIPSAIFMNPTNVAEMELSKASDGHYVMPPFTTVDGTRVKGLPVVENNGVTAGEFYVGDFTKFKVKVRETMNINYGHSNDDFEKNLLTAIAEGRAAAYIPNNYFGSIVKGNFAAAKTALETV